MSARETLRELRCEGVCDSTEPITMNFAAFGTTANAIAPANTYRKPRTIRQRDRKMNKSIALGRRGTLVRDCAEVTSMSAERNASMRLKFLMLNKLLLTGT